MKLTKSIAVFALLAATVLNCAAQTQRAVVTGTALDATQARVPGVKVVLQSESTGLRREVITNSAGVYYIGELPIGNYEIEAEKPGFRQQKIEGINLTVGQTQTINLLLDVASSVQTVSVEAAPPPLATTSGTVGGTLQGQQIQQLPLNGRNWTSLMALVPGAIDSGGGDQNSIRFAGRGNDDNNYRLDGVDATGISNQSQNASLHLQIPVETIAEFKVDTLVFSAAEGGTPGGQVSVVSRSGNNDLHGSGFEYLRNNVLDARNTFSPSTAPLRLNQFGGSVGGPVIKDRTFFFAAYEGLRQRVSENNLIASVPSDAFRSQVIAAQPALAPLLNSFPHGTIPVDQYTSQAVSSSNLSTNEDSGLIRIDHRFTDSTTFFARYNIDEALQTAPSGNLRDISNQDSSPMNGTMQLTHVFSPTLINEIELGVNRARSISATQSQLFNTAHIVDALVINGYEKLNQVGNSANAPTTYSLLDNVTKVINRHTIRAGIEIKKVNYNYSQVAENDLVYTSYADLLRNHLAEVDVIGGVPMHGLHKVMSFGYLMDEFKVTPDLTVTAGLRYEFFNRFHEIYGRDLPFDPATCGPTGFCPTGSEFSRPVTNNLEPRLSLAYAPKFLGGKTVIRAGGGLYKGEGQLGDLNAPSDNTATRFTLRDSQYPNLSYPVDALLGAAARDAVTPRGLQRQRADPTVAQWGMQVQTALPGNFVLDTGYMGSHGYHLFTRTYVNLQDPRTGINPLTGVPPIAGIGQVDYKGATSNSSFNAFQTSLQRTFRSGWLVSANYMWSHSINDGAVGGGEADYPQLVACRACEKSSSDQDVRHTVSVNTVYQLPFGAGRQYLNQNKFLGAIVGGWQLSSIGTYRSGLPVNIVLGRSSSVLPDGNGIEHGGSLVDRPDLVPGVSLISTHQTPSAWLNPAAFLTPADFTYGNAGRNIARGPQLWEIDLALVRTFKLTERLGLDFRADCFNVLNRAQYANPDGSLSDSTFGQITSTVNNSATGSGTPRQIQFSLRLSF